MPRVLRFSLAGLAFALAVSSAAIAVRADPTEDERGHRARAIAENVMSPFCPGMTLAACTSPAAREWRTDIREWVGQGLSDDEIRRRLEQRAGHDLSGTPRSSLGWLVPLGLGAGSLALLVFLLRKWVQRETKPPVPKLAAEDDARLEALLEKELERDDS
jgi:cytochrome c-type biogenesis protein CcmH/NrfF